MEEKEAKGEEEGLLKDSPNATVIHLPAHNVQQKLLDAIRKQVRQHGTLTEIVISMHGGPNALSALEDPSEDPTVEMKTDVFLDALKKIQEELGSKVANRIVFIGCNVLTEETPELVDYYRRTAQTLGSQIVGYTTLGWGGDDPKAGSAARFNPDGSVDRDPLLHRPVIALFNKIRRYGEYGGFDGNFPENKDDSWFDCHENRTQQGGASCQLNLAILEEEKRRQSDRASGITGYGSKFPNLLIPSNLRLSALEPEDWAAVIHRAGKLSERIRVSEMVEDQIISLCLKGDKESAQNAVGLHVNMIHGLFPEDIEILEGEIGKYKKEQFLKSEALVPNFREGSRNVGKLTSEPNDSTTNGPATKRKPSAAAVKRNQPPKTNASHVLHS